ncbi:MAG: PAS domain S-box protein [Salinivenus sp.]
MSSPTAPPPNSSTDPSSPAADGERLRALRRFQAGEAERLKRPPFHEQLDQIAELAASLFDAPLGLVTFVDQYYQWHEGKAGTDMEKLDVTHSFCVHAIESSATTVVPDLRADDRFADNAYVKDEPHHRFYAGAPIETADGHRLGTVCVLDQTPREPDGHPTRQLENLADLAMEMLEKREASIERDPALTQTVLDSLPGTFHVLDRDGHMQRWNAGFEEVTGLGPDEIEGRHGTSFFSGASRERVAAAIQRVFEEGAATVETEILSRTGPPVPILFTGVQAQIDGETSLVGMGIDISEQRRQRQALRQKTRDLQKRERRFRQVTETIEEVFWLRTAEQMLYVSPSFENMWGRPEGRLYENVDAYLDWIHPEDYDRVAPACRALVQEHEPLNMEYRIVRADGEVRWLDVQFEPVIGEGEEVRFAGIFRDITDRKRVEHQLRRSEETHREILDGARDSICVLSEDGTFLTVNHSTAEMLGRDRSDLIGCPVTDVIDPEQSDLSEAQAALDDAVSGETRRLEVWCQRADGTSFPKDVRLQPATYFGDDVVLGVGRDITDRKERERALREAKEVAEKASRLKTAMLQNVSHELRTPLTSIISFGGILEDQLSGQNEKFARLVNKGGERLLETLDAVLKVSRLDSGAETIECHPVDLQKSARTAFESHRLQAEAEDLSLDLERPGTAIPAQANRQAVGQVLAHLLDNAIKFTDAGGSIWIRVRSEPDVAAIEVEDTGVGIAEEAQDEIFEAFEQESKGLDRQFEGSGLGLTVARLLACEMGGRLEVDSEKGTGSRFVVKLPPADRERTGA